MQGDLGGYCPTCRIYGCVYAFARTTARLGWTMRGESTKYRQAITNISFLRASCRIFTGAFNVLLMILKVWEMHSSFQQRNFALELSCHLLEDIDLLDHSLDLGRIYPYVDPELFSSLYRTHKDLSSGRLERPPSLLSIGGIRAQYTSSREGSIEEVSIPTFVLQSLRPELQVYCCWPLKVNCITTLLLRRASFRCVSAKGLLQVIRTCFPCIEHMHLEKWKERFPHVRESFVHGKSISGPSAFPRSV